MGTLFVVATPIGNLEDLSFRALRVLREVDLIAAEDTRRTSKLLAHYEIRKPLVSLHEHNERREAPRLVARLQQGESIALVSDAGTPGIADPGQHLVSLARTSGLKVTPVPGPSAIMAAISASGFPADRFVFMGFPPRSGKERQEWIGQGTAEERTVVAFEAPHRIQRTLDELSTSLVNRPIYAHREMTKIHEQLVIYTNEAGAEPSARGEYVLVIPGKQRKSDNGLIAASTLADAAKLVGCLTINGDYSMDDAMSIGAKVAGVDPSSLKKALKKARIERNRREAQDS